MHINPTLNLRQQYLIKLAAFATKNDIENSGLTQHRALDAGMKINEIKEVLIHVHAYAGFPASLLSLHIFKQVLVQRSEEGKNDDQGRNNNPVSSDQDVYQRGKNRQKLITGMSEAQINQDAAFAPIMDAFLKEHLFGHLFDRDILSFADREIITVSVLAALHHPFIRIHIIGSLNVGISSVQLQEVFAIIEKVIGQTEAESAERILKEVVNQA